MRVSKTVLTMCASVLLAMPLMASAQSDTEADAMKEAHLKLEAAAREMQETDRGSEEALREAEKRMEEAAQEITELSRDRTAMVWSMNGARLMRGDRARLGVMLDAKDSTEGPVSGAAVAGVSPGGAAEQAGLEVGDQITAINDESFSADSNERASEMLVEFMRTVKPGDELSLTYLRDGKPTTVKVVPQEGPALFEYRRDNRLPHMKMPRGGPDMDVNRFLMFTDERGWGDMELVSISKELGRYFGAEKGLLVIKAPGERSLQLQDGDVIESIDGREPKSVHHAMRILGSYQSGEKLELKILRDKKRKKITVEIPENDRDVQWRERVGDKDRVIRKEIAVVPEKERT